MRRAPLCLLLSCSLLSAKPAAEQPDHSEKAIRAAKPAEPAKAAKAVKAAKPVPAAEQPDAPTAQPIPEDEGLPHLVGLESRKSGNWGPLPPEYSMEISAKGPSPADLTNRGLYQLQLFRSPQAARHFLAALEEDRTCAMAWFGLYLALLERGEDCAAVRENCLRQAQALRPSAKPHEQAWIDALDALHKGGSRAFATKLEEIRATKPFDLNAAIWLALMLRDGHDLSGNPRAGQRAGEALVKMLLKKHPGDAVLLHAWCQLALVGPRPESAIGQAKMLIALDPPSSYFRQAAGLVLYRSGDSTAAAAAFDSARTFEEASLQAEGILPVAAPTYFDNLDCLAMALVESGRRKDALTIAVAAQEIDLPARVGMTAAHREYTFFTLTTAARVHARCGDWQAALAALPPADHPAIKGSAFVATWMESLRIYFDGQIAVMKKDGKKAKEALVAMEKNLAALGDLDAPAKAMGINPQWSEARRLADFLQYDLRAEEKTLSGDAKGAATWWHSASNREASGQSRAVPRWPRLSAEARARSLSHNGEALLAVQAWEQAARERPLSGWALLGLRDARQACGDIEGTASAAKSLASVWAGADEALVGPVEAPEAPENASGAAVETGEKENTN